MRTAREMAIFCKENNTGSGMGDNWTLKHFSVVENQLKKDEVVLFAFVGLYNYKSLTEHQYNYAIAITEDRIIAGQKRFIGENVNTITRRNLNDISKNTGILMGILTIDTYKETINIRTTKQEINIIYEGLNNILFKQEYIQQDKAINYEQSPATQLKEFKELLDMKIITQEEFDIKKKDILGL